MKIGKLLLALALGSLAMNASARARKDCATLKDEIETKFQSKGVHGYSLDVVPAGETGPGKVVGTCDGGSKRIVYSRGGGDGSAPAPVPAPAPPKAAQASPPPPPKPAPAAPAPKKKTAPPPAIGNY